MENQQLDENTRKLTTELREGRREELKLAQEFKRLSAFEKNRFAEDEIVTEADIKGLCSRIKRRKRADVDDLHRLADAFLQTEENITAFLKVTGAINILIKEFTGSDRSQQLLAGQCLCNLSLGDETSCAKIATFAGSYLMIFMLNSSDAAFSKMCIWITQNIVAGGGKPMNILMSQELLKNCLHVLNNCKEHENEAILLLDLIVDAKFDEFTIEEKREVEKSVWNALRRNHRDPMSLQLLIKITGSSVITPEQLDLLISSMTQNFIDVLSPEYNEKLLPFTLKLLLTAFNQNPQKIQKFIEILLQKNFKISDIVNKAVTTPKHFSVIKQLLQFIALINIYPDPIVAQYFTYDPPSNWKIPKIFEF